MSNSKPILILQLCPEDDTSDNEFAVILKYGCLEAKGVCRMRIEKNGIPDDLVLEDYCAVIVGGSPFDISTPEYEKSTIQKKIERDFNRLFDVILTKEACDTLPAGATLLMTGAACPVQMFRMGENVYATQFHPEADSEGFIVRIHAYKHHGYFEPDAVRCLIDAVSWQDTPYAQKILKRFVDRYAR